MSGGITKDRFVNLDNERFDCVICQQVVINPKICRTCHNLFCKACIMEWQKKKPNCPFKCNNNAQIQIGDLPVSVKNLYDDLEVQCGRNECNAIIKLKDLMSHEMNCGISKCFNFEKCGNTAPYTINDMPVCSEACYIVQILKERSDISDNELLNHLEKFVEKVNSNGDAHLEQIKLSWVSNSQDIKVNDGSEVSNNLEGGGYHSAVTDQGFVGGIHYFEVIVPSTNRFPIKLGVTLDKNFDMNSKSFSDMIFGYSFFTKGQLRHNSDSMGLKYGKDIRGKQTTVGVIVNLSKGQIGFMIDGEYQGVAFENAALLKGPVYPAVS